MRTKPELDHERGRWARISILYSRDLIMNSAQSMLYMSAAVWPHIWGLVEMHLHRPSPYLPALKQGLA